MKKLAILALGILSFSPVVHARATCVDGHEDEAAAKAVAVVKDGVLKLLQKKGIAVNAADVQLSAEVTYDSESGDNYGTTRDYEMLDLLTGTVKTASGTELDVILNGDENLDQRYVAFYEPVLKSNGFDKEGNPLNPHCSMTFARYVGYVNEATLVTVRNAASGHVIGSFALPASISLY